ncbi:hypothetical protein Tco_0667545 [Tanacetum coccineum]
MDGGGRGPTMLSRDILGLISIGLSQATHQISSTHRDQCMHMRPYLQAQPDTATPAKNSSFTQQNQHQKLSALTGKGNLTQKEGLMIHPETTMVTNTQPFKGRISPKSTIWGTGKGSLMGILAQEQQCHLHTQWPRAYQRMAMGNIPKECVVLSGASSGHCQDRFNPKMKNKEEKWNAQGCVMQLGIAERGECTRKP